jgi:anti-sigma factor (TIGR02949 family)
MTEGCPESQGKHDCREVLERAQVFLDGEVLDETQRIEIREHLEDCGPCFQRYGVEREVRVIISRLKGSYPCPQELRAKIEALFTNL